MSKTLILADDVNHPGLNGGAWRTKMSNNKDVLSMLQSRIAKRANLLAEYVPDGFPKNGLPAWPAVSIYVDDQKADKKAMKEIVQLRRAQKALCKALTNYSKNSNN